MKVFYCILILILKTTISHSQPKLNEDSLRNLLTLAKADSTRILLLAQLSGELNLSNPDSALHVAKQGLGLAQKLNYSKGERYCKTSLARYWWSIGDFPTALKLLLPVVRTREYVSDQWLRTNVNIYLPSIYRDQGDYQEALKYASSAIFMEETYNACKLCRTSNVVKASIFLKMNQLDSAHYYLKQGFLYPAVFGDDGWIYMIVAQAETELKAYDSAFFYYQKSIQTLQQENNQKDLAGAFNGISTLFERVGNRDSVIRYAHKSLQISRSKQFARETLETSLLLAKVYESISKDSALYYNKLAMAAKDSLYNQDKQRSISSYKFNEELRQQELQNAKILYRNQLKIYVLIAVVILFIVIAWLLWRNNRQKQRAYALLQRQKQETDQQKEKTEHALAELKITQAQLIQSERMASLGELTAGIAHEIQNPLNFVNNFSETNVELLDELEQELNKGNIQDAMALAHDAKDNEQKINLHGKRADSIVKGMLEHSRTSKGEKQPTIINALVEEYLRLAYYGFRAKDKSFNVTIETGFDENIGKINIVPQDIGRVLLNLLNNAFYAVAEKRKQAVDGYEPNVTVVTKRINDHVEIIVKDNGNGIPKQSVDKIFQPFFTTKPTGQGTGLGLSLSYDIVKAHGGELKVESTEGEGATFTIILPAGKIA